jgi:hypothetical protein
MTDRLDEIRRLVAGGAPSAVACPECGGQGYHVVMDGPEQARQRCDWCDGGEIYVIAAAPELLAWAAGEIERLRGVNDGVRDWAQGRVDVLSRCIDGNRVDLTTRTEMMYERTIMRDLVAMFEEEET